MKSAIIATIYVSASSQPLTPIQPITSVPSREQRVETTQRHGSCSPQGTSAKTLVLTEEGKLPDKKGTNKRPACHAAEGKFSHKPSFICPLIWCLRTVSTLCSNVQPPMSPNRQAMTSASPRITCPPCQERHPLHPGRPVQGRNRNRGGPKYRWKEHAHTPGTIRNTQNRCIDIHTVYLVRAFSIVGDVGCLPSTTVT